MKTNDDMDKGSIYFCFRVVRTNKTSMKRIWELQICLAFLTKTMWENAIFSNLIWQHHNWEHDSFKAKLAKLIFIISMHTFDILTNKNHMRTFFCWCEYKIIGNQTNDGISIGWIFEWNENECHKNGIMNRIWQLTVFNNFLHKNIRVYTYYIFMKNNELPQFHLDTSSNGHRGIFYPAKQAKLSFYTTGTK